MYKPTATLISPNSVCYNIPKSPDLNRVGATSTLVSSTVYCVAGLRIQNTNKIVDKSEIKGDSFFNLDAIRAFVQRFSPDELVFNNDINSFDLINHSWCTVACKSNILPCPRIFCSLTVSKNKLYVYGGLNENLEVLNDFWEFDLQTKDWKLLNDFSANGNSKFLSSILSTNNTATLLPKSYKNYSKYEWEDSVIISNGVDQHGKPSNSTICYVLAYDEVIYTDIKLPRMNENITKNCLLSYPEKTTSILRDSCLYFTIYNNEAFTYSLVNSDNPQFIETKLPHNEIILSLIKIKIFALINTNIVITGFKDGNMHVFLFNLRTKVLSNLSTLCELHPGNYHIAYNVFLWRNHSKLILFGYNVPNNEKEFEAPILQKFEGIIFFDLAYTNLTKFSVLNDLKNHLNSDTAKKHFKNACKQKLLDSSMDEEDTTIDAEFPLLVSQRLDNAAAAANATNEKSRSSVSSKTGIADNSTSVPGPSGKDSGFMKATSDFESYVNYLVPESNLNLASTVYSFFNNSAIALGRNFFQRFSQNGNVGHLTDFRFISADEKVICFPMNILLKRWGPHFSYILADAYLKNIEMVMENMDDKPINNTTNSSRGSENYNDSTSTGADRKMSPKKSIVSSIATFTMHQNSVSDYSSSRNSAFFDSLLHRRPSIAMDGTISSNNLKSPVTYYLLSNNILSSSASSTQTSNTGSSRRPSTQNNIQGLHQNQIQSQHQQQGRASQNIEGIVGLSSMDDSHIRHTPIQANRRLSTPVVFNKPAAKSGAYTQSLQHSSGSPAATGSIAGGRFSYGTVSSSHSATSGSRNKFPDSSIITDFKNSNSKIIFNSPFENNKKISVSTSTSGVNSNQLDDQGSNKNIAEDQASTAVLPDSNIGSGLNNQISTGVGANASHYTEFLNLPSSRKNSVISNTSSLFSSNSSNNNNNHTTILNAAAVSTSAAHGNSSSSHSVNENINNHGKTGSASPQLLAVSGAGNLDSALSQSAGRQQSITSIMDKFSSNKQHVLSVPEQTSMPNFSAPLGSPPLINPASSSSQSQFAYGNNISAPRATRIGSVASASSNLSSELSSSSSSSPSHQAPRNFHNIGEYQTYPFGDTVTTVVDRSQFVSENEMVSPKTRTRNNFENNNLHKEIDDKNLNTEPIENMRNFQENNFTDRSNPEYSQVRGSYSLQNPNREPKMTRDTNADTISENLNRKNREENEVLNIINGTLEEYTKYYDFIDSEYSYKDAGPPKGAGCDDTDQSPANSAPCSKKQFLLEPLLIPRFMYLPVQSDTVKVMCEFFLTGKLNKHTPVATVLVELYMLSKFYNIPLLHNACSEVLYAIFSKIENFVVTYLDFLDYQLEDMIKDVKNEIDKVNNADENKLRDSQEKLKKLEYLKRYYDKVIAPFGKYIRSTHGSDSFYIPIAKEFAKYNFILRKYSNNVKFDDFWSTDLCEFINCNKSSYAEKQRVDDEYSEYEFDCDELEDLMFDCSLGRDPRFGTIDNTSSSTFEEVFKSTFIRKTNNLPHKLPGKDCKNPKLMRIEDVFDSSEPPPIEIISLIYQSTVLLGDTKFMLRCLHLLKTHKIVQEFKKPVEKKLKENLMAELRAEEKILEEQKEKDDQLKLKQSMKDAEQRKKEKLRVEEFEKVKVEKERLKEEQRLRKLRRREQHQRHRNHHSHLKDDAGNSARITRSETDLTVLGDLPKKHVAKKPDLNIRHKPPATIFTESQTNSTKIDGSNEGSLYKQQNKSASSLTSSLSSNISRPYTGEKTKNEVKDKIIETMRLNLNKSNLYNTTDEAACSLSNNSPSISTHNSRVLGDTSSISSRYNHNGLLRRVTDIGSSIGLKTQKSSTQTDDFTTENSPHHSQFNKIVNWINNHSINPHSNHGSPKYKSDNSDGMSIASSNNRNKHLTHFPKKTFKFSQDSQKKSPDDNISFKSMVSNMSAKSKDKKHKDT